MSDSKDRFDALAGEYVLGTLTPEVRAEFSERLKHDSALQDRVEAWHRRLEPLDGVGETVEPPAELWNRIAGALDEGDVSAPDVGALTVRSGEEGWFIRSPGVEKKVLYVDHDAGLESYLLRLAPGARIAAHQHRATEECLMLEGELDIGTLHLRAGDYHVMTAGTDHPEIHSAQGAVAYLRTAIGGHSG